MFSVVSLLAFKKDNFSRNQILTLHTYVVFAIFFFTVLKQKDDSNIIIIIEDRLPVKSNQIYR